jgi:uracil phosphoribosyltransferase
MKKHPDFLNLYVSEHPLVLHKLSQMRQPGCGKAQFKALLKEISWLMGYEVTRSLPVSTQKIETPLAPMDAPVLKGKHPVIVPILRAGLGMAEGLEELMPESPVGHIGLYRDAETKRPVEYLVKLPHHEERPFILVDPMLATGHSAKYAFDLLVKAGISPAHASLMALVSAPEGVKVLQDAYPQTRIYTAALDDYLNDNAYIVPGLGDAGDRLFGTNH